MAESRYYADGDSIVESMRLNCKLYLSDLCRGVMEEAVEAVKRRKTAEITDITQYWISVCALAVYLRTEKDKSKIKRSNEYRRYIQQFLSIIGLSNGHVGVGIIAEYLNDLVVSGKFVFTDGTTPDCYHALVEEYNKAINIGKQDQTVSAFLAEFKSNSNKMFTVTNEMVAKRHDRLDKYVLTRYNADCLSYDGPISQNMMIGILMSLRFETIMDILLGGCALMTRNEGGLDPEQFNGFIHSMDGPQKREDGNRHDPMTLEEIEECQGRRSGARNYITHNLTSILTALVKSVGQNHSEGSPNQFVVELLNLNIRVLDNMQEHHEANIDFIQEHLNNLFTLNASLFEEIFKAGFAVLFRSIITSLQFTGFDALWVPLNNLALNNAAYAKIQALKMAEETGTEEQIMSLRARKAADEINIDSWYHMLSGIIHSQGENRFFNTNKHECQNLIRFEILNLCFIFLMDGAAEHQARHYYRANPKIIPTDTQIRGNGQALFDTANAPAALFRSSGQDLLESIEGLVDRLCKITMM
jgi:hypothetical protein